MAEAIRVGHVRIGPPQSVQRGHFRGAQGEVEDRQILPLAQSKGKTDPLAVSAHLSMPYACMMDGKVVRVPITVTAECIAFPPGTSPDQIQTRVAEAFQ